MIPAHFKYVAPKSLREAAQLLKKHGRGAKLLAGGHSLIPMMKLRLVQPQWIIDLRRLNDLKKMTREGGRLLVGALCTHTDLATSLLVARHCPLLGQAAAAIGDVQVRNRGTLGGSLAHSDPAADYPAALLALEAEIKAASPGKSRIIKASDFFRDLFTTALQGGEILTQIRIPIARQAGAAYLKLPQKASGFAIVGAAALARVRDGKFAEVRLAFNGVASRPYRAAAVEAALKGRKVTRRNVTDACQAAAQGVELLGDIHASEEYRAHLAAVYGSRAILTAAQAAG